MQWKEEETASLEELSSEEVEEAISGLFKDEDPVEKEPSFIDKLRSFFRKKDKPLESAGINLERADPSRLEKIFGRASGDPYYKDDREFQKLLRPLSGPEILLIERELQADETIFVQIENLRAKAAMRQTVGLLVGLLVVAAFLFFAGAAYITETMPRAAEGAISVSNETTQEILDSLVFSIGFVLPVIAISILGAAVRFTLQSIGDRSNWLKVFAAIYGVIGLSIMILLVSGSPLAALVLAIVYLLVSKIEGFIRDRR